MLLEVAVTKEKTEEFVGQVPGEWTIGKLIKYCAGPDDVEFDADWLVVLIQRDVPTHQVKWIELLVSVLSHINDALVVGYLWVIVVLGLVLAAPQGDEVSIHSPVFIDSHGVNNFFALDIDHIGEMPFSAISNTG